MPAPPLNSPLLIVGASVRAAAQSALRAGFTPVCADAFADADLRSCARVVPVEDFPRGLPAALQDVPVIPWIYTGGLENHPGLLARLERDRPLWGNGADIVRRVRNPRLVAAALQAAHLPALEVRSSREPPPADGTWMLKPRGGSAGRGVVVWDSHAANSPTLRERHYFQQRRQGGEYSALFLGSGTAAGARLIGISRQLIGLAWANAPTPTAWCGNIVPSPLAYDVAAEIRRIGTRLAREFALRGLFGCDFLLADNVPWVTEVNPRYTGSVELFEFQQGRAWLTEHADACRRVAGGSSLDCPQSAADLPEFSATNGTGPHASTVPGVIGKLIVYASRGANYRRKSTDSMRTDPWKIPEFADIPVFGQSIPAGTPVCTVFAIGHDDERCLRSLQERAGVVQGWLE